MEKLDFIYFEYGNCVFILKKIDAVDISSDDKTVVRVFMQGVPTGYHLNCGDEETAKKVFNELLDCLKTVYDCNYRKI